jgi:hypothetical protein
MSGDDMEMCDACDGSGVGVADTICGKCDGAGGYPMTRTVSPSPFADALKLLEQHYYTDDELAQWLTAPQPLFEGLSALQMLAAGRKNEVLASIQRLDDGVYL